MNYHYILDLPMWQKGNQLIALSFKQEIVLFFSRFIKSKSMTLKVVFYYVELSILILILSIRLFDKYYNCLIILIVNRIKNNLNLYLI